MMRWCNIVQLRVDELRLHWVCDVHVHVDPCGSHCQRKESVALIDLPAPVSSLYNPLLIYQQDRRSRRHNLGVRNHHARSESCHEALTEHWSFKYIVSSSNLMERRQAHDQPLQRRNSAELCSLPLAGLHLHLQVIEEALCRFEVR